MNAIERFVKKRPFLIWYTKNYAGLSDRAIVEAVLNYGDFQDVKKLIAILGMRKVSNLFYQDIKRRRNNYRPEIRNYFKLYFAAHA